MSPICSPSATARRSSSGSVAHGRWNGDMRKRWTAAGMLVAEQQFRRIIGYKDLAKLVISIERHTFLVAETNRARQEIAEPVTV